MNDFYRCSSFSTFSENIIKHYIGSSYKTKPLINYRPTIFGLKSRLHLLWNRFDKSQTRRSIQPTQYEMQFKSFVILQCVRNISNVFAEEANVLKPYGRLSLKDDQKYSIWLQHTYWDFGCKTFLVTVRWL